MTPNEFLVLWVNEHEKGPNPLNLRLQDRSPSYSESMLKVKSLLEEHPTSTFAVLPIYRRVE